MIIRATLVLPTDDSKCINVWKGTAALKYPVAAVGSQPRTKDMVTLDNASIDSLPQTIEVDTHANQDENHSQLGVEACVRVLN